MSNGLAGLGVRVEYPDMAQITNRALNERTRLKIAITEILVAMGHEKSHIKEAIEGVCNCNFSKLKDLFEIHSGD
jgi:methyl coenzyme M reductase subunit D